MHFRSLLKKYANSLGSDTFLNVRKVACYVWTGEVGLAVSGIVFLLTAARLFQSLKRRIIDEGRSFEEVGRALDPSVTTLYLKSFRRRRDHTGLSPLATSTHSPGAVSL